MHWPRRPRVLGYAAVKVLFEAVKVLFEMRKVTLPVFYDFRVNATN
jgi:hypothetical protein